MSLPLWIGVTAYRNAESSLVKQGAILFDQLITNAVDDAGKADVIDRLLEAEVIRTTISHSVHIAGHEGAYEVVATRDTFDRTVASVGAPPFTYDDMREALSRGYAKFYEWMFSEATILPLIGNIRTSSSSETRNAEVLRVVLEDFPLPSSETPWEAILDWRRDDDVAIRYRRIRAWINALCRGDLSPAAIRDEIATLVDDYQTYMNKRYRTMTRSRLEVIATTAGEVMEDLMKVRLSAVVPRLFALFKEEAPLLESELDAPGREIAYIVQARGRFG
jgi:hypothetical protein